MQYFKSLSIIGLIGCGEQEMHRPAMIDRCLNLMVRMPDGYEIGELQVVDGFLNRIRISTSMRYVDLILLINAGNFLVSQKAKNYWYGLMYQYRILFCTAGIAAIGLSIMSIKRSKNNETKERDLERERKLTTIMMKPNVVRAKLVVNALLKLAQVAYTLHTLDQEKIPHAILGGIRLGGALLGFEMWKRRREERRFMRMMQEENI